MTALVSVCFVLFAIGLYGVLTRRDLIAVLASVEIMLGSANVLLVGLARLSGAPAGAAHAVALTVMVVAAAEAAVGMALLLAAVKRSGRRQAEEFTEVSG
ncbi:MAG: NADH-quinone oxidoreductase subunit NuoK [Actinobacteria bacterium]|nr:MAG: NADH-quinone oxidoreductase subunit NuoK [Actinomycetota bacterium]